jgi:hypothetical protein
MAGLNSKRKVYNQMSGLRVSGKLPKRQQFFNE